MSVWSMFPSNNLLTVLTYCDLYVFFLILDDSSMAHLDFDGVVLGGGITSELTQHLTHLSDTTGIREDQHVALELKLDLVLCEDSGVCLMEKKTLHVELENPSEIVFSLD